MNAARLRALPLAVLVAIVVVAVTARIGRRDATGRGTASAPELLAASSSAAPSGLAAPLRTPLPLADASVPTGAPRMLHGSPTHVHRAAAHGPEKPKVGWRTKVGGAVAAQVTASPDGQTLYAATLEGSVVALATADGATRWTVALGDRVYSTPFVSEDGTIVVGTDAKKVVALDPRGNVVFRLDVDGEADTGAVAGPDGTTVIAAGRDVLAVKRGGDLAWRFSAKGKIFTSPAIAPSGLVVVGSQDDHVYAIGPGGALAWSVDLGADVDGAAAIGDDGAIFVGTDKGEIVRLGEKGAIAWRASVGGYVRGTLSIARNGDVLAGTYGPVPRVVRVAPDGTIRGAFVVQGTGAKEFGIHGGPLEDEGGVLYFGAQDDRVYAIGPDGSVRWRFETKGDVDGPLTMLPNGSLVVPSEDGTVTLLLP